MIDEEAKHHRFSETGRGRGWVKGESEGGERGRACSIPGHFTSIPMQIESPQGRVMSSDPMGTSVRVFFPDRLFSFDDDSIIRRVMAV